MIKTKFAVFLALALAAEASAQSTWIGGNTTNNWLTGTNWSTGASPNATDATVVFSSAGSTAWTNATNTIGTLLVSGGQAVIGNANITSDVLNLDTSSGKPVISNTTLIFMYADLAGTNGFTKLGSGELSFRFNGNPMLFTGDINLNAGTLTLNQDSSLGNTNNDIIVGGTSTLSSSPGGNTGTVTLGAGRSISVTNGTLSIQNGNANVGTAINGAISGAGNLTFAGTGTLTLNGANTYSGTTLVSGGRVNIGASGTIGTNSLTVGNTATMDLGGSTQTVRGLTLSSAAGTTRVFTFTNGSLVVGDGNTLNFNGTNGTTADFSGLTSYVANSPSRSLTVQPNTPTAGSSTNYMLLAKTGIASNTLTYSTIRVGGGSGASQGTLNGAIMQLGKVNAIKTGLLTLGGFNGYGTIELPAGISNATLSLRGVDGTSRMGGLVVGETSSGTRSGAGTLNLSNGVIDALVTNTYIGVFGANSTGPATTSLLAMGGGTFDTVNMVMATITNTGITNASASVGATFQQNGGTVTVQTLTMGQSDTTVNVSGPVFLPTYNLNSSNAVLRAQTVTAGASTNYGGGTLRKINFGAGTIQNYDASTDLTISGKDTTSSGRIEIAVASNSSSRTFLADAGRKITIESTAVLTSTGNIVKAGLGTLVLNGANTYSGGTAVSAGTLTVNNTSGSGTGSGALTVNSGATLNGVGFIGSATDIGGIHSPGNSPGIQTFTGGLTYLTGATFVWELTANASAVRGTAFDGVDVTGGTLSINTGVANNLVFNSIGSSVVWSDAFWDSNQVWLVFSNAASPSIASGTTFDTINISFDSLGNDFATSRAGSSFIWTNIGNDVYLNYTVPEPGTYALLALAAAVLGVQALRRRSRRQLCGVGRLPTLNPEKNGIHKA